MDPQEVKNTLKKAKDAIKGKEFQEALRLCKSIIDKDKGNYLAWVMTAAAAQELGNRDQALAAFQRAIQISEDQAPAWQGLAQLYEKANNQSELVGVYSMLRKLFANDPDKSFDYSMKYSNVLAYQGKKGEAVNVLYSLFTSEQKGKDMKPVVENLAKLLADKSINDKVGEIYFKIIDACKKLDIDRELIQNMDENSLISMKREQLDWRLILYKCLEILQDSPFNENIIKTMIQIYHESLIGKIETNMVDLGPKLGEILANESFKETGLFDYNSLVVQSIRDVDNLNHINLVELKNRLAEIEKLEPKMNHPIVVTYLKNTYYSFICNLKITTETSDKGLNCLSDTIVDEIRSELRTRFQYNKALLYYVNHDFRNSIENFKQILEAGSSQDELIRESTRYLLESYLRSGNKTKAVELSRTISKEEFKSHWEICDLVFSYYSKETSIEACFEIAKNLAEKYPNSYDCNFLLAKITFDLIGQFKELNNEDNRALCFQANIKAIKLSPYKWEPIFHLGNYYSKLIQDVKKALKCYQKSFDLCQNLDLCGLELVDALLIEKEEDVAVKILVKAIEEIENCKWASLRLGVIYLKKGEANEAIKLFHNVIRNDPNDFNMWECLADAYLSRGSPIAALKSFTKAVELNPDSSYAYYKIAHIKQSLNLFDEAVMDYFAVLNKITNHVPTFKGLGETYYELARANIKTSTDNKYLEYIELSIKYLTKAICMRKDLSCLWKILGDCCLLISTYPRPELKISIPKLILDKDFSRSEADLVHATKFDLLRMAEESYIICCKLKPEIGSYWYNLGLSYFTQHICNYSSDSITLLLKAKECLINSINLEPNNHVFWNLLAVIYSRSEINKPHLAQHCFIKSLKLNDLDTTTWTNLGAFYLIHDHYGNNFFAHECFKKSQAIDPEYNIAWIGQAFIAEKVDNIEESIDLYRHSVELGLHTESLYGYARIVCKIFTDLVLKSETIYKDYIEYLNAIPLASDCLVKYCERITDNPDAHFLCAVLFQKLSLPLTSIKYYERVFELVQDESNEMVLLARRGYARILCEQKEYEAALLQYKKIDVKNSIEDMFALAKVFYQLGKYQQCTKIFESALAICPEDEKSIVYTAMGMSQSKYNIQEAISSFFKSFQCKQKCIQSLFALCSIGLLKKDKALINAVFKELETIDDIKYKFDIIKLKSIYYCLEKDFQKAIKCLSKYVHEYPHDSKCWIELCLCLKRSKNYDLALTIAYGTFKTYNQANLIFYECIQHLLLQKLKLSSFSDEDGSLMKMFQKTLHIFPAHTPSWTSFSQFLNCYKSSTPGSDLKPISARIDAAFATPT